MTLQIREYALQNYNRVKVKPLSTQTDKNVSALKHFRDWALEDTETKTWKMSPEDIVRELKAMKKNVSEDEYKEALYFGTLQPFIDYLENIDGRKSATKQGQRTDLIKLNATTIKGYVSEVRGFLLDNYILTTNEECATFLTRKKAIRDKKHALSKEEIRKIIAYLPEERRLLYIVLTASLMRIGEAITLKKSDIEDKNGRLIIHINALKVKTKKARDTYLTKEAEELLRPHLAKLRDSDFVFQTNGDPNVRYSTKIINEDNIFKRTLKRAGLCTCKTGDTKNCIGKYQNSNRHIITPHTFRSYGITALNRIEFGLGNKIADHEIDQLVAVYDRNTENELMAKYDLAESQLTIFSNPKLEEAMKQQLTRQEEMIMHLQQKLNEIERKKGN